MQATFLVTTTTTATTVFTPEVKLIDLKVPASRIPMNCDDCPICFETINVSVTGLTTLSCGHSFHFRCLATWFVMNQDNPSSCPYCRKLVGYLEDLPTPEEAGMESDSGTESGFESVSVSEGEVETGRIDTISPLENPSHTIG